MADIESLIELINKIDTCKNLCVFFGAGASKYAELPLIGDLTRKILDQSEGKLPLNLRHIFTSQGHNTVEDLLSYLIRRRGDENYDDSIKFIERVILESVAAPKRTDLHERLLERLFRHRQTVHLITPNYDLIPELALDKLGIDCVNGFRGRVRKKFDDQCFVTEEINMNPADKVAFLYKVHGSIGWADERGEIIETFLSRPSAVKDVKELLIFPSSEKYTEIAGSPFRQIQQAMGTVMRRPDTFIIVVGYGWGDSHLNIYLKQASKSGTVLSLNQPTPPFLRGISASILTENAWITPDDEEVPLLNFAQSSFWRFEDLVTLLEQPDVALRSSQPLRVVARHHNRPKPSQPRTAPVRTSRRTEDPYRLVLSSYKMVVMSILLSQLDAATTMPFAQLADLFRGFYMTRLSAGLTAEVESAKMVNPHRDAPEIIGILKQGPLRALLKDNLVIMTKRGVALSSVLVRQPERLEALRQQTQDALETYFSSIKSTA